MPFFFTHVPAARRVLDRVAPDAPHYWSDLVMKPDDPQLRKTLRRVYRRARAGGLDPDGARGLIWDFAATDERRFSVRCHDVWRAR